MPEEQTTTELGTPRSPRKKHRPSMLGYLVVLFVAAFMLLLLSYFMQQRRSDQELINGLQQNISAMQSVDALREQNQVLTQDLALLKEQIKGLEQQAQEREQALTQEQEALKAQLEELEAELARQQTELDETEQTALALDWLWRIEREYFQGRRANARTLIQAFQEAELEQWLPETPLVDLEYRSPLEQYEAICRQLF